MSISGLGTAGVGQINLAAMDLETALMTVQSQRAQLLDDSLRQQLDSVSARNAQIAGLNEANSGLRGANAELETANVGLNSEIAELKDLQGRLAASRNPNPEATFGLSYGQGDDPAESVRMLEEVRTAGLTIPTGDDAPGYVDGNATVDVKGRVMGDWIAQIDSKIAGLEARITSNKDAVQANNNAIADNKTSIDSLGNTQQMEMLRLQSLTNKRNEAFDVMTNFIKKMQDSRSSIVGNMR